MDLKTRILTAKRALEKADIPEWDFPVYIRRMTLTERGVFADATKEARDSGKFDKMRETTPILLALTLCDENGDRIFKESSELKDLDSVIMDRIALQALKVNKLTKEEDADLEKKSPIEANSGSNSISPGNSDLEVASASELK